MKRALEGLVLGIFVVCVLECSDCQHHNDEDSQMHECKVTCEPRMVAAFSVQGGCKCSEK
jgi:hypothetical protein